MKKGISFLLILFSIILSIRFFQFDKYINVYYLQEHISEVHFFIDTHYFLAVIAFVFSAMGMAACAVPGCTMVTITAGFLFGTYTGALYALCAQTSGAIILFLLTRFYIGTWVQKAYAAKLMWLNNEMYAQGHKYLLIVRLLAIVPFCVVNMLAGLTPLSLYTYSWVTLIGLIPVSCAYAYAGNSMAQAGLFSHTAMYVFSILIFFKILLIPVILRMYMRTRKQVMHSSSALTAP